MGHQHIKRLLQHIIKFLSLKIVPAAPPSTAGLSEPVVVGALLTVDCTQRQAAYAVAFALLQINVFKNTNNNDLKVYRKLT